MRPRVSHAHLYLMFARKHLLRWLTTAYRQPDPFPNSAQICPIKPNRLRVHPPTHFRIELPEVRIECVAIHPLEQVVPHSVRMTFG